MCAVEGIEKDQRSECKKTLLQWLYVFVSRTVVGQNIRTKCGS